MVDSEGARWRNEQDKLDGLSGCRFLIIVLRVKLSIKNSPLATMTISSTCVIVQARQPAPDSDQTG